MASSQCGDAGVAGLGGDAVEADACHRGGSGVARDPGTGPSRLPVAADRCAEGPLLLNGRTVGGQERPRHPLQGPPGSPRCWPTRRRERQARAAGTRPAPPIPRLPRGRGRREVRWPRGRCCSRHRLQWVCGTCSKLRGRRPPATDSPRTAPTLQSSQPGWLRSHLHRLRCSQEFAASPPRAPRMNGRGLAGATPATATRRAARRASRSRTPAPPS